MAGLDSVADLQLEAQIREVSLYIQNNRGRQQNTRHGYQTRANSPRHQKQRFVVVVVQNTHRKLKQRETLFQ